MLLDPLETLSQLIAIPSVNPMGLPLVGEEFLETRVTAFLEDLFRRLGVPFIRQVVEPARENIIARFDGSIPADRGGELLLLEAHQDTVPTTGMTIDPFDPVVREGRIYGRGACDIKGGMAAMLAAFARIVAERPANRPTVVMACTVDEEYGFGGAAALEALWTGARPFIARRPDAAVVAEPTSLDVVVAHKGVVRWECVTHGRAAHSSQPETGDNAIYKMAKVVAALERYAAAVGQLGVHPLCGRPTLSVGTIAGGVSVNIVPERCAVTIDRRLLPDEDPLAACRATIGAIAEACPGVLVEHEAPFLVVGGLSDRDNGPLATALAGAAAEAGRQAAAIGVPFGTNASSTAAAGVPSVVFGPGSIAQAHTADEWLPVDELHAASEVLYRFARRGLL